MTIITHCRLLKSCRPWFATGASFESICLIVHCLRCLFNGQWAHKYYIAGISDTFCLCYYFLCVLYTLAYVWGNDPVISCLYIDFFMECRPHIHQPIHCTQNVGTFVEQISDFSCVSEELSSWVKNLPVDSVMFYSECILYIYDIPELFYLWELIRKLSLFQNLFISVCLGWIQKNLLHVMCSCVHHL